MVKDMNSSLVDRKGNEINFSIDFSGSGSILSQPGAGQTSELRVDWLHRVANDLATPYEARDLAEKELSATKTYE